MPNFFNDLKNKYFEALKPAQQTLSNVGQQFSNLGTNVRQVQNQVQPTVNNYFNQVQANKQQPFFNNTGNNPIQWMGKVVQDVKQRGVFEGLHDLSYPILQNPYISPLVEPRIGDLRVANYKAGRPNPLINSLLGMTYGGKGLQMPNISKKLQQFTQQNIKPIVNQVANQPLLSVPNPLGFGNIQTAKPTLKDTYNILIQPKSTIGQLTRGNLQQVPNALASDYTRGIEQMRRMGTVSKQTPEDVNTFLAGMIGGPEGKTFSKQQLDLVRKGFSPEVRDLVGQFTAMAERNPTGINRKNLGLLGEYVQSLGDTLFGKNASTLTNKQLANAFDAIMKEASKGKGITSPFTVGLSTKNIRQGEKKVAEAGIGEVGGVKNPDTLLQDQPTTAGDVFQPKETIKPSNPILDKSNTPVSSTPIISQPEPLPWEAPGYKQTIPTDIATQTRAEAKTVLSNQGKGGIGGLDPEIKTAFQDWVNTRRAVKVEGLIKNKEFSDLNNKGMEGILEFQSGDKTGRFGDVKKYFDTKYEELQKAGIDFNYKKDYLPQLWANTEAEVQQVFGKNLGTRPSFTLDAIIKNYEEGIKAGLKPRFNNISDLAGWYEEKANKVLADKKFFDRIGNDGFIQPSNKAPQDWVTIDPDRFPKVKVSTAEGNYVGAYKAPPELAKLINNYLKAPQFELLNTIANYVSRAKNITLSFGIPKTAINAHGVNILARHTLFGGGGNPITRFLVGAKYMLNYGSASKYLNKELSTAPKAIKAGLTLSTEEHTAILNEAETIAKSLGKGWNSTFEKPLFNKMIPALKLSSFNNLVENGMAEKDAAKLINNVYGGINWEQMGRNRDTQNLLRTIILAPDWAETSVKLGGNMIKSLNPLAGGRAVNKYRMMTASLLGSVVTLNVANKLMSGHYAYENEPGHTFELEIGYTQDGQKRYLRPYGTAADFMRLPFDAAMGLKKGDPSPIFRAISNRFSIPLASAMHLLSNQDYKGQAIYGKDKYGNEITPQQSVGGIGSEALGFVGFPSFSKNAIDVATGRQGTEEGLTQGFELPFRYTNLGKSNVAKQLDPYVGLQGQQLYDFNKNLQGQNKLSNNQIEGVKASDNKVKAIQDVLDIRKMKSDETKMKENLLNNQQSNSGDMAYAAEKTVGNKTYYTENGTVKTIDLSPPTKGQGIDAFSNRNWNINKALNVYSSGLSQEKKNELYKQLSVDPKDLEYAYKANKSTDIKTQYTLSQNLTHDQLLERMKTGRVESIAGDMFASNGLLDNLNEKGLLSDAETKALKAIKLDKNGKSIAKAAKAKKLKKVSFKGIKAIKLKLPKSKAIKVKKIKAKKIKVYKLKKVKKLSTKVPKVKLLT